MKQTCYSVRLRTSIKLCCS